MKHVKVGADRGLRQFQKAAVKKFMNKRFMTFMAPRQHGKSHLIAALVEDFVYRFKPKTKVRTPYVLIAMKTMDQAMAVIYNKLMVHLKQLPESYVIQQGSKSTGNITLTVKRPWFKDHVTIELVGSGNIDAVKGRTVDFLLLDEYAFQPEHAWLEIYKPMLEDTKGKAFITSTIYGRNHFYKMCKSFEKLEQEDPSSEEGHLEFTAYDAGVMSEEEIETTRRHYDAQGKGHIFNQEYLSDPDAIAAEEAPFSLLVRDIRMRSRGMDLTAHKEFHGEYIPADRIFASFDIGKPTQNPIWEWYWSSQGPHIVGYKEDDVSQNAAIERLIRKYPGKTIWLLYPWDAAKPSVEDGRTFLEERKMWIQKKGYDRRVVVKVLPKTQDKKNLLFDGLNFFPTCKWDVTRVQEGLDRLSTARLRVDKQHGAIDYGTWVKNDGRHAADAFLYVAAAVRNNLAPRNAYNQVVKEMNLSEKAGRGTRWTDRHGLTYVNKNGPKY